MLNTRKFQTIGVVVLIVAAALVSLSAIRLPAPAPTNLSWPSRPDFSQLIVKEIIPVTSNEQGQALYHRSEWSASQANQSGLNLYHQSERVNAYPAKSNEAGLEQYHQSEHESFKAADGMTIYHQSERGSFKTADGMTIYHQSEWFGK